MPLHNSSNMADQGNILEIEKENLPPFQFIPHSMEHDYKRQEMLRRQLQSVQLITNHNCDIA